MSMLCLKPAVMGVILNTFGYLAIIYLNLIDVFNQKELANHNYTPVITATIQGALI